MTIFPNLPARYWHYARFAAACAAWPFVSAFRSAALVALVFFMFVAALLTAPFAKRAPRQTKALREKLEERARSLFIGIAKRHNLVLDWDSGFEDGVACWLRQQPGLDFDLWLSLQNDDEIVMSSYLITAEWFPFSEENKVRDFADAVDGLISGEMRLLCHFGVFGGEPSSVELQRPSSGGWITIFRYGQAFAAPAFSTNAVFNQARASSS